MSGLPKLDAKVYHFQKHELPSSSFIPPETPLFGKFVPFILLGEGGLGEHKQLNWTNLYLVQNLGHNLSPHESQILNEIKLESDLKKIQELITKLPERIQNVLAGADKPQALVDMFSMNTPMLIMQLSKEIALLRRDIQSIMSALGIKPSADAYGVGMGGSI